MVPSAFSPSSRSRISRMPCGSRPLVGSSSTSSRGDAQQGGGQAEPLAHAERVALHPAVPGHPEPDLVEHRGDPVPAAAARRPHGVEQLEVRPPAQVRVRRGALDQRADLREHRRGRARHRLAEHLGLAGGGEHQAEQHPDRRRLARAVGAEEAVDVAGAHVEVDAVDGQHRPVPLGQRPGADHRRGLGTAHRKLSPGRCAASCGGGGHQRLAGDRAGQQPGAVVGLGVAEQQPQRRGRDQQPGVQLAGAGRLQQVLAHPVGAPAPQRHRQQHGRSPAVDADGPVRLPDAVRPAAAARPGSSAAPGTRTGWRRRRGRPRRRGAGARRSAGRTRAPRTTAPPAVRSRNREVTDGRRGPAPEHLHLHRQAGRPVGVHVDATDARLRVRRAQPQPQRVPAGDPSAGSRLSSPERAPDSARRASSLGSRSAVFGSRTATSGTSVTFLDS